MNYGRSRGCICFLLLFVTLAWVLPQASATRIIPSRNSPNFMFGRLHMVVYLFDDGIAEIAIDGTVEISDKQINSVEFMIVWPSTDVRNLHETSPPEYYNPVAKIDSARLNNTWTINGTQGSKYTGMTVHLNDVTNHSYFGIGFEQLNFTKTIQQFPYRKMMVQTYLYFDWVTWEYCDTMPKIIANYSGSSRELLVREQGFRGITILLPQYYFCERVLPSSAYVDEYHIKSDQNGYHGIKPFDGNVTRIRLNPEARPADYYLDLSLSVEYSKIEWWQGPMPLWLVVSSTITGLVIGIIGNKTKGRTRMILLVLTLIILGIFVSLMLRDSGITINLLGFKIF